MSSTGKDNLAAVGAVAVFLVICWLLSVVMAGQIGTVFGCLALFAVGTWLVKMLTKLN